MRTIYQLERRGAVVLGTAPTRHAVADALSAAGIDHTCEPVAGGFRFSVLTPAPLAEAREIFAMERSA